MAKNRTKTVDVIEGDRTNEGRVIKTFRTGDKASTYVGGPYTAALRYVYALERRGVRCFSRAR